MAVTAGALNIPVLSHAATADTLSNKQLYPTFARLMASDSYRIELTVKLLKLFGYRALGLVYIDDAFGTAFRATLQTACAAVNIRLVASAYRATAQGDDLLNDVRRSMKVITEERIRIIYHAGVDNNFIYAMAQVADELDWIRNRMYFANRVPAANLLDLAPDPDLLLRFLQGSLTILAETDPALPEYQNVRAMWPTMNMTELNEFIPNGTAKNGAPLRVPDDYLLTLSSQRDTMRTWTLAYDTIMTIGMSACGPSADMIANMRTLSFDGVSGPVSFDAQLNRQGELYTLGNIQVTGRSYRLVRVGKVAMSNWTIDWSRIQFDDKSNILPIDIEPPNHQIDQLTVGAKVWGIIEGIVAIVASLVTLFYLISHRTDQAFIESQPIFMSLLACGCLFMGASIFGLVIENDFGCMFFPWMFSLGFTLSLASLSAKSFRVAILWYSRGPIKKRNSSVRATVLLGGVGLAMLGLLIILICWQIFAPLTFVINTTKRDSYNYPLYSSAMCVTNHSQSTTFLALVITYVCLTVFVTMWVSFWVRNAPEKFQEAKMTAIAGVSMFQVFFVGIPTAAAVWNMALPRFLVLSSLVFLLCLIILCTMFLPKAMRDRFGVERSSDMLNNDPNNVGLSELMMNGGKEKGVINIRGKKRKADNKSDSAARQRSVVERVLESVQEIEEPSDEDAFHKMHSDESGRSPIEVEEEKKQEISTKISFKHGSSNTDTVTKNESDIVKSVNENDGPVRKKKAVGDNIATG